MKKLYMLLFMTILALTGYSQNTFYVSSSGDDSNQGTFEKPFRTIQKALDGSIGTEVNTICLRGGTYFLQIPLLLHPEHSMSKSLKITNYEFEKAVISGGKQLTGWKQQRNGLWMTDIPEVKNGNWSFRQIYVNGSLRHRARKPNEGFLRVKGMPEGTPKTVNYHTDCQTFEFAEGDIRSDWKNPEDVEVIVYHFWTDSHLPIQSIDDKKNLVTFKHKAGKTFTDDFSEDGARYIVENVFEELDFPGEWYLDKKSGKCYYYPQPEEKIGNTTIMAPVAEQLLVMHGDPLNNKNITGIKFDNIEFCYTNFELPEGNSNDRQGSASIPAAISLKGVHECSFTRCRFINLGTWAFEILEGCTNNTFSLNEIGNIAAGGFRVNGGYYKEHPFLHTSGNQITLNHIHNYGDVYPSAVGILLQHTFENNISNNDIHDGYYTGISIGWQWGYQRSISRDNLIEYNHIHHIGKGLLSDMGAIYTLGVSPGTKIRNNLIHDVDANHYGGWGIYHDEGSTHLLVENNVVYNTKFAAFNIHFAKEVTVRNNIFALGRLQQINRTRVDPHKSVFFEQNIVYWKEGNLLDGKWKDEPYKFYFHSKNESGTREVSETFDMNYNLYFNPSKSLDQIVFGNKQNWTGWKAMGKDVNSVYEDPLFEDVEKYNFTLKPDSPAFKLGFKQIDLSKTGLGDAKPGPQY